MHNYIARLAPVLAVRTSHSSVEDGPTCISIQLKSSFYRTVRGPGHGAPLRSPASRLRTLRARVAKRDAYTRR